MSQPLPSSAQRVHTLVRRMGSRFREILLLDSSPASWRPPRADHAVIRNRRAHPRFAVQLAIHYRGTGWRGMGRSGDGLVTNISEGGLLIAVASRRVSRGTKLMLELQLGEEGGSLQVPGVVVRSTELGSLGIRFGSLEAEQRAALKSLLKRAALAVIPREVAQLRGGMDRRRYERAIVRIAARIHTGGTVSDCEIYSVSRGGLGALSTDLPPTGAAVRVVITPPEADEVIGEGSIVWTMNEPEDPPRFGVMIEAWSGDHDTFFRSLRLV